MRGREKALEEWNVKESTEEINRNRRPEGRKFALEKDWRSENDHEAVKAAVEKVPE